jgi:hypothetical protein
MNVVLNDECLETALPNVPARAVAAVIASGVGREQPLHSSAQVGVGLRTDYQVKMVGQQSVSQRIHGKPSAGVNDDLDEGVVVTGLMDDGLAAVAATEHVITHAAHRSSGSFRRILIAKGDSRVRNIRHVAFFCPLGFVIFVTSPFSGRWSPPNWSGSLLRSSHDCPRGGQRRG